MSPLNDYLLSSSYQLTPQQIQEIVDLTLYEAANSPMIDRNVISLRIARLVSGVGNVKVPVV